MNKYALLIIIPIFLISIFFVFTNNNDEIVEIHPVNPLIKRKVEITNEFIQSYSGKAAYENLIKQGKKKIDKINLKPKPEKPIKIQKKDGKQDVFDALASKDVKVIQKKAKKNKEISVFDNLNSEKPINIKPKEIKANNVKKLNVKSLSEKKIAILKKSKIEKDKFYVQLAYSKSVEKVKNDKNLINQNNSFLKKKQQAIYKIKKPKGLIYELLVGPFDDFKAAKIICTKVKLQENKCIIVKK